MYKVPSKRFPELQVRNATELRFDLFQVKMIECLLNKGLHDFAMLKTVILNPKSHL